VIINRTKNVRVEAPFKQVCVWPGTHLGELSERDYEKFMEENFKVRVKFLEIIVTGPDWDDSGPMEGTGHRHDLLFAVHEEDVRKFSIPRLISGIRWIEDVLDNELHRTDGNWSIYPARVAGYRTW
jgi:hypothetical protein